MKIINEFKKKKNYLNKMKIYINIKNKNYKRNNKQKKCY